MANETPEEEEQPTESLIEITNAQPVEQQVNNICCAVIRVVTMLQTMFFKNRCKTATKLLLMDLPLFITIQTFHKHCTYHIFKEKLTVLGACFVFTKDMHIVVLFNFFVNINYTSAHNLEKTKVSVVYNDSCYCLCLIFYFIFLL